MRVLPDIDFQEIQNLTLYALLDMCQQFYNFHLYKLGSTSALYINSCNSWTIKKNSILCIALDANNLSSLRWDERCGFDRQAE